MKVACAEKKEEGRGEESTESTRTTQTGRITNEP